MAWNLLINKGASITGTWARVEPAAKKNVPMRVIVTNGSVVFAGENVYLEQLVGGLPANPGPLGPQTDTGVVVLLATIAPSGSANGATTDSVNSLNGIFIDAPVDYIRARTGAFSSGTCSVFLIEAS